MRRRSRQLDHLVVAAALAIGVVGGAVVWAAPNPQGVIALYSAELGRYVQSGETIYYEDPLPPGSHVFFLEMTAVLVFRNLGTGPLTIFSASMSAVDCAASTPNLPRSIEGGSYTGVPAVIEVQGDMPWSATFTFANNSTNEPAFVVTLASKRVLRVADSALDPTLPVEVMEYAKMTLTGISMFVLGDVTNCATGEPVQPSGPLTKFDIEMFSLTSLGSLGDFPTDSFFDVSFTPDSGTAILRVPGFEALEIPQLRKLILAFPALWIEVLMPEGGDSCLEVEKPGPEEPTEPGSGETTLPDLIVEIVDLVCTNVGARVPSYEIEIEALVTNIGMSAVTDSIRVTATTDCDGDTAMITTDLGPGAMETVNFTIICSQEGCRSMRVEVDNPNSIHESNEVNNSDAQEICCR